MIPTGLASPLRFFLYFLPSFFYALPSRTWVSSSFLLPCHFPPSWQSSSFSSPALRPFHDASSSLLFHPHPLIQHACQRETNASSGISSSSFTILSTSSSPDSLPHSCNTLHLAFLLSSTSSGCLSLTLSLCFTHLSFRECKHLLLSCSQPYSLIEHHCLHSLLVKL